MEPEKVEAGPPALIEAVVRMLTPPVCREHVLGDLWERYRSPGQYLSDAMRTVPFVLASRIRRTVSAPLLAVQAISVFMTFAGPSLTPVRSAVAATIAAVAILSFRPAYRVEAPQWPHGPAMDALAAASGAVLFSILLQIAMPRHDVAVVAALDCGAGAFLLVFFASVLWASRVSGRPPLRRRVIYLATCAAWAAAIAVPATLLTGFAMGVMIANGIIGRSAENLLLAESMITVLTLGPTAAVMGAMVLCVARPRWALAVP